MEGQSNAYRLQRDAMKKESDQHREDLKKSKEMTKQVEKQLSAEPIDKEPVPPTQVSQHHEAPKDREILPPGKETRQSKFEKI